MGNLLGTERCQLRVWLAGVANGATMKMAYVANIYQNLTLTELRNLPANLGVARIDAPGTMAELVDEFLVAKEKLDLTVRIQGDGLGYLTCGIVLSRVEQGTAPPVGFSCRFGSEAAAADYASRLCDLFEKLGVFAKISDPLIIR